MKQHEAIELRGYVTMYCKPKTVGDLRSFMKVLDSYYLEDDTPVEDGVLTITREGDISPIQCGCSVPGKPREWYVDALLMMHDCETE